MAFRRWRHSRPFWAGLLTILGGLIITYGPASAYKIILTAGDVVWEGILVGALIVMCGLFLWFQPSMRHFFGVLIAVLSVLSFITSDIGGFFIGMTLSITGGSMGFAWVPVDPSTIKPHVWQRHARHEWKERRRLARLERRRALEEELGIPEAPVPGVSVERPVAVPGVPVEEPAPKILAVTGVAEGPAAMTETIADAGGAGSAVIETTGEEVERLPLAEATSAGGAHVPSEHLAETAPVAVSPAPSEPRTSRRFPFRGRRR